KTVLGRDPNCQVVINGSAVSRAHAHILRAGEKFYIEDLMSRNKTYVNNQELTPNAQVELRNNDRIKICDFLCTFQESQPAQPLPEALREAEPEPPEDPFGSTTVEASLGNLGSRIILET